MVLVSRGIYWIYWKNPKILNALLEQGILCEKSELPKEQTDASSGGEQEEQSELLQEEQEVSKDRAIGLRAKIKAAA